MQGPQDAGTSGLWDWESLAWLQPPPSERRSPIHAGGFPLLFTVGLSKGTRQLRSRAHHTRGPGMARPLPNDRQAITLL